MPEKRQRSPESAERIRDAALEGFAMRGVKGTSVREIAAAAGVSPGLVQHHYPNKEALVAAVDEHVLGRAVARFSDLPDSGTALAIQEELARRMVEFVGAEPLLLRYVARSIIEGEEAALRIFDAFLAISDAQTQRLKEEGFLRPEADLMWTGLHVVIFNLATVLFETALDRRLPAPWQTPAMLERWSKATADLFRVGVYQADGE